MNQSSSRIGIKKILPLLFIFIPFTSSAQADVKIIRPFTLTNTYTNLILLPLNTSSVQIPPEDDNTNIPVLNMLSIIDNLIFAGIKSHFKKIGYQINVSQDRKDQDLSNLTQNENTLILKARVTELDPGSRAARMFLFGIGGRSKIKITGTLIDLKNNQILLEFEEDRSSGAGFIGGRYEEMMTIDILDIAEDIAEIFEDKLHDEKEITKNKDDIASKNKQER